MNEETKRPENGGNNYISNDGELMHDGIRHEHFNLQSSQTQPFDSDRMSGRPTVSSDTSASDSASSESDKK